MRVPALSTDMVRANWPVDVPFDIKICREIQKEWIRLKMYEKGCIFTFIRIRVPTTHKGEVAIQPECSNEDYPHVPESVGPFSHGTGGGVRNIRKGEGMS